MYTLDHKIKKPVIDLLFHLHEFDVDLESNHIYLMGVDRGYEVTQDGSEPGIDYVIAKRFIKNLNMCMRINPDKPIVVHMKTCGGDWNEGMAIYDTIRSCPSKVIILNYTHARSMSSLILQAADKRMMMPHSYFMFHDGTYGIEGTYKGVMSNMEFDKRSEVEMLNIYADRMNEQGTFKGKNLSTIKEWLRSQMDKKEDVFLTAEETVEMGFADEIFDFDWGKLTS